MSYEKKFKEITTDSGMGVYGLAELEGRKADKQITELQGRLKRADEVICSCIDDFETDFVLDGVIVDEPPLSFVTSYKALKKYQEGDKQPNEDIEIKDCTYSCGGGGVKIK